MAPDDVLAAIDAADELIGDNTIPMNVRPNTSLGNQMTALAGLLEIFNSGLLTDGCH